MVPKKRLPFEKDIYEMEELLALLEASGDGWRRRDGSGAGGEAPRPNDLGRGARITNRRSRPASSR